MPTVCIIEVKDFGLDFVNNLFNHLKIPIMFNIQKNCPRILSLSIVNG